MSNLNSVIKWENLSDRELIAAMRDISQELSRRESYLGAGTKLSGARRDIVDQERLALDSYFDVEELKKKVPLKRGETTSINVYQTPVTTPITSTRESRQLKPEEIVINDTVYTPVLSSQPRSRQVKTTTYELPPNTSIMPSEVVTVTTPVSSPTRSPVYRVKRNE